MFLSRLVTAECFYMNGAAIVGKSKRVRLDQPAYYRVYLQGILDASWSAELQGMNFHLAAPAHAPAMTVLSGALTVPL